MTDISALESYAGQLSEAASRSNAASAKQHGYVHGDDQFDVETESGPVPSIAKQARLSREKTAVLESELANPTQGAKKVVLPYGGTVANALQHVVPTAKTSAAVLAALQYAGQRGLSVEIPDGVFTGPDITYSKPVSMILRQNSFLDFGVEIAGRDAMKLNSVTLSGDLIDFPAGTTVFPGNFSAYKPGDIVMIELSNGGSPLFHEAGLDFAVAQDASATQLVISAGTRLAYRNPKISKLLSAARHTGSIPVDSIAIAGNYTAHFVQGDIIRIENVDGVGGVEGSQFYFEYAKVAEISTARITLEMRTVQAYANPWLVKVDSIHGVKISGGRIKRLTVSNANSVFILSTDIDRTILSKGYRQQVIGSVRRGLQEPSTSNATWLFNASMSDIYCGGSAGVTDNAAFKVMSCPNLQLNNISGGNTKAVAQGNYGVFIDFFYTPYRIWNANIQCNNIRGETPNGGSQRGVWLTGVKNGDISATGGQVFIQSSVDSRVHVQSTDAQLEIADVVRSAISGESKTVSWQGCVDSRLNVTVRDSQGSTAGGRCVWARATLGRNPETGAEYTYGSNNEFNVVNYSANSGDTTLYIQNQVDPLIGSGCRDKIGLVASVAFGSGVSGQSMAPNFFKSALPSNSGWISARVKGYLGFEGDYRDGGIKINNNYLWVDSLGRLRISAGRPTAELNGAVVGSQS